MQMGRSICTATLRAVVWMLTRTPSLAQADGWAAAAAATPMLPWLVLLGRCCLLMGEDGLGVGLRDAVFTDLCLEVNGQTSVASIPTSILICVVGLATGPHAADLSGLGYDLQLLQQQARDLMR